jgi:uracil-DNA glycosylase family 4
MGLFEKSKGLLEGQKDTKVRNCRTCGLYDISTNPKMGVYGNTNSDLMVIGSHPTKIEDNSNRLWVDSEGGLLRKELNKLGVDIEKIASVNSVNCRSYKNPTEFQIDTCRKHVFKLIKSVSPKMIITIGRNALASVLGLEWGLEDSFGSLDRWRGLLIPSRTHNAYVAPTHSLSVENNVSVAAVWRNDLKNAIKYINEPLPLFKERIYVITAENNATKVLKHILRKKKTFAFDIETTGKKPHKKGHSIKCIGIAFSEVEGFCMEMPKIGTKNWKLLKKIMEDESIGKIAHHMKYEHTWMGVISQINVKGWVMDTLLAAHQINNARGFSGLKFQTYVNFGVAGYGKEVEKWIHTENSTESSANDFNRLEEGWKLNSVRYSVMEYCAKDSLFTFRLYNKWK